MFGFLWHFRGSVPLQASCSNDTALDGVERLLEKQRKPQRTRGSDRVTFDAPLWDDALGPNWLALGAYDHGCFWIEQEARGKFLRYDLRSLHGLVFCGIGALMFFLFGLAGGGIWTGLKIAGAVFVWLYGGNRLLSLFRVPQAIGNAVRGD